MSVFRNGTSSVCFLLFALVSSVLLLSYVVPLGQCEDRIRLNATGLACHSDLLTDVCVINGPVVIDTTSLKVYAPSSQVDPEAKHIIIKPYPLKGDETAMSSVSPVEILTGEDTDPPPCQHSHNAPAIVFSSSGFTGNIFHEFNDVIIPTFITSSHFQSRVHFIVSDFRPWFVEKYQRIINHLTDYRVIDPAWNGGVHCFPGAVIGLHYHGNLNLNATKLPTGHSVLSFKQFLKEYYHLKITRVSQRKRKKPVLVLISRTNSRTFLNEDEMVKLMEDIGFTVVKARTERMYDLENFAEVANSCSVLVGAHGAGLTNALFLPLGAVVVQVVPLGLDWPSTNYFGDPAREMGLHYLEYKTVPEESSLSRLYGPDDPVIADPAAVLWKSYRVGRALYIDGQNLTVDLKRFRGTVAETFRLVQHPVDN